MKIQFVSTLGWHSWFMDPIAEEMRRRNHEVKTCYGSGSILPDWVTVTSYHEILMSPEIDKAKIVFFIEHCVSTIKGAYELSVIPEKADYILVQGPVFYQWLLFNHPDYKGALKTGWPRIDKLLNMPSTREEIIKRHNLDSSKPIILFTPTWDSLNKPLQGGTMSEAFPVLKKLGLRNLLVLPHPSDYYSYNIFKDESNVILNADNYFYLAGCDLVIGDLSSILVEFTVRNKPIIQIDKYGDLSNLRLWYSVYPDTRCYQFNDLFGIYQLGEIVPIDERRISNAIEDALSNPDRYKPYREHWKNISFYNLGNSAKICADEIERVVG